MEISYKYAMDTIHHFNEIIDHNIIVGKIFLLPQVKDGEVIRAQVKAWGAQFDQEQDMFLVSLEEGQATETITYDAILKVIDKQLQHESELEDKGQLLLFRDIIVLATQQLGA